MRTAGLAGAILLAAIGAAAAARGGEAPAAIPIDPSWGASSVWDDGRAEVATYASHRRVYGIDRAFDTTVITVKEDLDRARGVKADPPLAARGLVTALKMNIIARIQTENYPYDYMASVFVRRDDPRALVKLAVSSQEWCGTTYKEVVTWDGPPRLQFHSYFDGQADGSYPLDLGAGSLLEEQLPLVMRAAAPEPGRAYTLSVYEPLITNAAPRPAPRRWLARLAGEESVTTPAGAFATRRIVVSPAAAGGEPADPPAMTFWIGRDGSRPLVKMESADGRSMLLADLTRRDYWTRR